MLFLSALSEINKDSNPITVVRELLSLLKVKVSNSTLKKNLKEHPDYPSLLSMSDALTNWKISNTTILASEDLLRKLPMPCVVQIDMGKEPIFTLIRNIGLKSLQIFNTDSKKWVSIEKESFLKIWTGTATLIHAVEDGGEPEYSQTRKKEVFEKSVMVSAALILLFSASVSIILSIIRLGWESWYPISLICMSSFGTYITVLLTWGDIDKSNISLQKVCKSSTKVNCNAVLHSKHSKIFGFISWSEIGFMYFFGNLINLIVIGPTQAVLTFTEYLSLLATPYIIFSIYYQWKIIKQWCILCLAVQAVLFIEFLLVMIRLFFASNTFSSFSLLDLVPIFMCFIIPFILWFLIKPMVVKGIQSEQYKIDLERIKKNHLLFDGLLAKGKKIEIDPINLGLVLGNPNPTVKIIKVCNPYCGPCAKAHPEIDNLLETNSDLQVQIIFTATDNENDIKGRPVRHLLAISEKRDEPMLREALSDWYDTPEKNYDTFANKHPLSEDLQFQNHKLRSMSEWCKQVGISFTPTFFINGYQLPEMYSISDLKYFL